MSYDYQDTLNVSYLRKTLAKHLRFWRSAKNRSAVMSLQNFTADLGFVKPYEERPIEKD